MSDIAKLEISAENLEFREITRDFPEHVKKALQQKEAVHRVNTMNEIADRRLAPSGYTAGGIWDKHCYGLFVHGRDVPEICVYTKLLPLAAEAGQVANKDAPNQITDILEKPVEKLTSPPNSVIFYSISNMGLLLDGTPNPQHDVKIIRGANGRLAGEELIHRVAEHVHSQYRVENYFTLSPLRKGINGDTHGFADWLEGAIQKKAVVTLPEISIIRRIHNGLPHHQDISIFKEIRHIHQHYNELSEPDQKFFTRMMENLGAYYLAHEKSASNTRLAIDEVGGRFHMPNGAEVANIHYLPPGKTTKDDSIGSLGLMVNYRYSPDPDLMKARKEAYKGGQVSTDPAIQKHLDERLNTLDKPKLSCHSPVNAGKLTHIMRDPHTGII